MANTNKICIVALRAGLVNLGLQPFKAIHQALEHILRMLSRSTIGRLSFKNCACKHPNGSMGRHVKCTKAVVTEKNIVAKFFHSKHVCQELVEVPPLGPASHKRRIRHVNSIQCPPIVCKGAQPKHFSSETTPIS